MISQTDLFLLQLLKVIYSLGQVHAGMMVVLAFQVSPPMLPLIVAPLVVGCVGMQGSGMYPPSSAHTGGVVAVFGDASVRFITNNIDSGNQNATGTGLSGPSPFGIFGAMGTRAGEEAISQ